MAPLTLFATLLVLMAIGTPVAVALGLSSAVTMLCFSNDSLASLALKLLESLTEHYTFLAIPFFILSSQFLSTGGVAQRLIDFAMNTVGRVRGGMAISGVFACMMFSAVSGSSPATLAAIGPIAAAAMVKTGYPKSFATGVLVNAGTLGVLIPPSIIMLVYCTATNVSVKRLFLAGAVPGLLIGVALMIAIWISTRRARLPQVPFPGWATLLASAGRASGGLMLIVIVMCVIYGGIASPTEAAAISAVYAFVISVFVYRDIAPLKNTPWRKSGEKLTIAAVRNCSQMAVALLRCATDRDVRHVLVAASKTSIMLLFVIANAMLFAHVLTSERIPHHIANALIDMNLPAWGFLVAVNILLLIAGNFMEPSAILLIMAPIFLPIALRLGIDPVHFGVIMIINMEIGMVTPPVGLNLFVGAGIARESMLWVARAAAPWLLVLLGCLIAVTFIPQLSLWLPNTVFDTPM